MAVTPQMSAASSGWAMALSALDSSTADEGAPASGPAAEDLPHECERECPLQSYLSRERERQSTGRSSPPPQRLDMSYAEAESASVSTIANVDNDALSSYDRRKEAVDTLPREVHSNSPPACAPTQQNVSTHHGRAHHSPFPTCQLRSLFFASHMSLFSEHLLHESNLALWHWPAPKPVTSAEARPSCVDARPDTGDGPTIDALMPAPAHAHSAEDSAAWRIKKEAVLSIRPQC